MAENQRIVSYELDTESVREKIDAISNGAQALYDTRLALEGVTMTHWIGLYDYINKELATIIDWLNQNEYKLCLVVGDESIVTINLSKNGDGDVSEPSGEPAYPGQLLSLGEVNNAINVGTEVEPYTLLGERERAITLDILADALHKNGTLEIIKQEPQPNEKERAREIEAIRTKLEFTVRDLKAWYESRDSDSVSTQSYRKRIYSEACMALEDLTQRCRVIEHQLLLIAGDQEIDTVRFSKEVYGFTSAKSSRNIPADESFPLIDVSDLCNDLERTRTVYIGKIGRKVEVAILAEALSNGASITLVPIES